MGVVVGRKCPMTVFKNFPISMGLIRVYDGDITVQMANNLWYSMSDTKSWNIELSIRVCNSGYRGLTCSLDMIDDQSESITPLGYNCSFVFILSFLALTVQELDRFPHGFS